MSHFCQLFCYVFLVYHFAFAQQQVRIIRVVDGDTLLAQYDGQQERIRLLHIDAPEVGKRESQPFGRAAAQHLQELCSSGNIYLLWNGKRDRNGRILAELSNDNGQIINQIMVREGYAWHYKHSKNSTYATLHHQAKKAKRGLWQDSHPVAPWDYRKSKKQNKKSVKK